MEYIFNDILGFETDTVWGLGCHPLCKGAVDKIYDIKGRDKNKPLILMSYDFEKLKPFIKNPPNYAKSLIDKYFPGAITLIFEKTELCPDYLTSGKNTVGIRIPNHKGFHNIARSFEGGVLATTSLNLSGEPPVQNYAEAYRKFGTTLKIIKPISKTPPSNRASTVILCTGAAPIILRQGDIFIESEEK